MRRILLTDLIPFTSYTVFIAAKTQYSQTFGTTPFEFAIVSTTEGGTCESSNGVINVD